VIGGRDAQGGNHGESGSHRAQGFALIEIGSMERMVAAAEVEGETSIGTGGHAVHAEVALGLAPRRAGDRVVATLAVEQAAVAAFAVPGGFVQPHQRPAGEETQQSTEWAQGAAPQAGDAQVQGQERDEDEAEQEALLEVRLAEGQHGILEQVVAGHGGAPRRQPVAARERIEHGVQDVVDGGEHGEGQRTHQQSDGIQPAGESRAEEGRGQHRRQQVVFPCLPAPVAIRRQPGGAALPFRFPASHPMVQGAQRADPAAEEAPQQDGGDQDGEAPQHAAIERAGRERLGNRGQRIGLQEQADRFAQQLVAARAVPRAAEFGSGQQPEEQGQKDDL